MANAMAKAAKNRPVRPDIDANAMPEKLSY
jgi:hypothetical protein